LANKDAHKTGHSGDESFQAVDCIGTVDKTHNNQRKRHENTLTILILRQTNWQYGCAHDCAQLW